MDQRTHSWIAIRAIALLEEEDPASNLVKLLKPFAIRATVGAWLPDQADAKKGGNCPENHVLKMEAYSGDQKARFTLKKDLLLDFLGLQRQTTAFLRDDTCLDAVWWSTPFKGDVPKPGQHLPNRIMGMSTMMKDLLVVGDPEVDQLIPGEVSFARYVAPQARTTREEAAMYFFMLSHFTADLCMPCHMDSRYLSGYDNGLHKELETHWSKKVGKGFEKAELLKHELDISPTQLLANARAIDGQFSIQFNPVVPEFHDQHDEWLTAMFVSRASFAVISIIAPCQQYPYNQAHTPAPYEVVFSPGGAAQLEDIDRICLHDAVLNTAIFWKHIWNHMCKL